MSRPIVMAHADRRRRLKVLLLAAALSGACSGSTDCGGCLNPLSETFPETDKINSVVQIRVTPGRRPKKV